jgi:hypothetical protein
VHTKARPPRTIFGKSDSFSWKQMRKLRLELRLDKSLNRIQSGCVPSSVEKEKRRNLLLSKQVPHNEDGGLRRARSYHDEG